jgi:hypothetical protein
MARNATLGSTTLEPPLGSGPYRIKEFTPGRSIVYERVKDYWGQSVNVNIGRDNFDELRFEYFRDGTVALEAFKADAIDWRIENSAKNWATAYDFPAVGDRLVLLEEFPIKNVGSATAWTVLDQTRGALPGRSDASPAIFVVLPPPDPPVLPPLLIGTGSRASAARAWRCAAPRSQSASPTLPGRWANTK